MHAVAAVQRAGDTAAAERRPVDDQPAIGDERRVEAHGALHAPADGRRAHLQHGGRPRDELQTGVARRALVRLLVGDQVTV